jgi:glycosyltransferase involved in cell wall biosynthesis
VSPLDSRSAWKQPIRVLVLIPQLEIGGAERHLLNVLPSLQRRSFEITIVTLRSGGAFESALRQNNVTVLSLPTRERGLVGLSLTVWSLFWMIRAQKPDLIHFFLPEAYLLGFPASLGIKARRIVSRRSLATYHQKRRGVRILEMLFHRGVDVALGNSAAVTDDLRREGIPACRLGLVHSGVDERFSKISTADGRRVAGCNAKTLIFVCVANFWPYKGHADLVRALAEINTKIPQTWKVLMVGRDEGAGRELQSIAFSLGVAEHLHTIESTEDVSPYLAAADIFVMPSHEEGFSNALLEAMMAGLPIVATAVGGNLDAIRDGVDGLLVPPNDPQRLGESLLKLALSPELRSALARNAQVRARERFSLESCVDKYADLYNGLVEGRYPPLPASLRPSADCDTCAE